jgi:hypothetical protein
MSVPSESLPSVLHAGRGAPGAADDGLRRAAGLVVDQACRLPGVLGAAILIATDAAGGTLEVVAAAGEHREHQGRFVRPDALVERLAVSAQAPVGEGEERLATLAVTARGDDPELEPALNELATLAALGRQDAGRAAVVAHVVDAGVGALAKLLALRDGYTADHAEEVVRLCAALALRLGLAPEQGDELQLAARLHDLGKIGVPDQILHKPGPLDGTEWSIMREHPVWGARALGRQRLPRRPGRRGDPDRRARHRRLRRLRGDDRDAPLPPRAGRAAGARADRRRDRDAVRPGRDPRAAGRAGRLTAWWTAAAGASGR